ncbi:glycosyltransferase family 2 protein [Candidatus Roizmanbacteria bacterium]|nr:glycosyltransferase family 2 protein [Candidatus Roizmanbacteria bacterium]
MNANLSVIIPTLNNVKGLKYLLEFFKDKEIQIIVVDNKPEEEKQKFIKFIKLENYKEKLIYLPQKNNLGFAWSINLGAKLVKSKWLLILNDDIEFENDQLINKLYMYTKNKKLTALSPILVNPRGQVENLGYKVLPIGRVELVKQFLIFNPPAGGQFSNIDGLTAACLLIKTSVFKKLRGFDESFFAYLEDVDFFLRFKKAGYKMTVSNNIKALHNHMTTSKTMGNFKARQDMINWWRLYFKHKDRFKFNFQFIAERLKNVSGFLKATFSSFFFFQRNVRG